MGIIRLTLVTVATLGGAMAYFGRDDDLPVDRIGREPTIAQDSIQTVSAPARTQPAATPALATTAKPEHPSVAQTTPTLASFSATPTTQATPRNPTTAAEKAEAAARQMASTVKPSAPAPAVAANNPKTAFVRGSTVNMRAGPSTRYAIVAKLTRGTEVVDMGPVGEGWNQIKVADTGTRGFMAARFLVPAL